MKDSFPFQTSAEDGNYTISADLESEALYPKYYDFFNEHEYEGNGYCWEGHITQILEQLDPVLLDHIEFDPEAGAFFAYADTKASMEKFVNLLSPIFADLTKLATYVAAADRDRVDA